MRRGSVSSRRVVWRASLALVLPLFGCSLTIDADRAQCATTADCMNRGPAFAHTTCVASVCQAVRTTPSKTVASSDAGGGDAGDAGAPDASSTESVWGCLDDPPVTTTEPGPFHVTFRLADILSQAPQTGILAKACKKLDVDCVTPDATGTTDDQGLVTLELARGFSGYVEFSGGTIMPGLYFVNPPVDADRNPVGVQIVTPAIVDALTKSLGSAQKPELGLMLINAVTCTGTAASHVAFAAAGTAQGAVSFYAISGLPAANATETDPSGFGGFVNVDPGTVPVTATDTTTGRTIATISLLVRAGAITYGHVVPLGR